MKEDHGVAGLQEVFGRRGAARAGAEVVDEADGLVFERDGRAAGGYEDEGEGAGVAGYEGAGEGGVAGEGRGRRVEGEVVFFLF